jgi:cell division protein FtsI (penicillin-binding protein 3)
MSFIGFLNSFLCKLTGGDKSTLETSRARLSILAGFSFVLFAVIVIRLADLTLMRAQEPLQKNVYAMHDSKPRADIVDRNGTILATSLQVASLYADPTMIENKPFIARQLEDILNITNVDTKLNKKGRFIWIKRGLTPEQHYAVNALGQPGLGFRNETKRFYPQGSLASHVMGYTNVDGQGISGLELQYNDQLTQGNDPLKLSFDIRIQYSLVDALKKAQVRFNAKAAIGGVVDIETGEILAAASLPDFDPHTIANATQNQKFNRFSTGVYEMGSTFKLFSTAAFLEKTNKPFSYTFDARKPLKEGRFVINDYHAQKRILTIPEVFIHSSNIGSALMGRKIGDDLLQKFYNDLGFMDRVVIDFPSRGKPLVPNPWRDINTLTTTYGHGIAVTPLHVLQATAAIVNGGVMPRLRFVNDNNVNDLNVQKRVLSENTAHKMRQLLRLNVTNGSGGQADVEGYVVGGKTGTSEKVTEHGYDKDLLLSSFIGVFPVHAPRYAILAILDEPKGDKKSFGYATGGWTAAPVVGEVSRKIASILAMPPSNDVPDLTAGLDRYLAKKENLSPASYD